VSNLGLEDKMLPKEDDVTKYASDIWKRHSNVAFARAE
jgi:hypothetical protein